ncbi:MAG: NAD(P)-binding domain-containing protein [Pseudomonadota bacterium]
MSAAAFGVSAWAAPFATRAALRLCVRFQTVTSWPASIRRDADLVVTMLTDDSAARAVWLGPDGALSGMSDTALAVEASTVSPGWIKELAAAPVLAFSTHPLQVRGHRPRRETLYFSSEARQTTWRDFSPSPKPWVGPFYTLETWGRASPSN